jgi:hypothetical protein
MPRAARWGLWAGVVLAAYFLVIEPVLDATNTLNERADKAQRRVIESRSAGEAALVAEGDLKAGVPRFGLPKLPGEPKERSEALTRRIASILQSRGVRDHTSTVKESPLPTGPLTGAVGADYRVDRLVTELQFDASPETVAGVVADLEKAAEVAAVSRVQLRKGVATPGAKGPAPRLLKATIAVEAWELVRKGRAR